MNLEGDDGMMELARHLRDDLRLLIAEGFDTKENAIELIANAITHLENIKPRVGLGSLIIELECFRRELQEGREAGQLF